MTTYPSLLRSPARRGRHARPGAAPAPAGEPSVSREGTVLSVALSLATVAAAFVGLGSVAQLLYPVAAVVVAAVLLARRRPAAFLEFALWLWLLSPEVRRVVDWRTGWHSLSYVMVAAPLATLLCLLPALRDVNRMHRSSVVLFGVFLVGLGYATMVGVVKLGPSAPAADVLQWLPPFALGLWIANSGPSGRELRLTLTRTAVWGGIAVGAYALVQFFLLPPWDSFWFENAPLGSLGTNEPLGVRVWSLLNSPGPMATVLLALLALTLASTSSLRWFSFALSLVAVGLSLVRAVWIGLAVMLLVLLTRLRKTSVGVLLAVGVVLVAVVAIGGPVGAVITDRFDDSVASGSSDTSYTERLAFHVQMLPVVVADPVGSGLGASGVATKLDNAGRLGTTGDFDGGALQVLFAFGPLVGAAVLASVLIAAGAAWHRSRRADVLVRACAAAGVALVSQLVFGNPFTSVSGVVLWVVFGVVARDRDERPAPAHAHPVVGRPGV